MAKAPLKNQLTTLLSLAAIALGMFLLAFAAVPLYRLFCQTTGFGGTPQQVSELSHSVGKRYITVRFDANTDKRLPWSFKPQQDKFTLRTGEHGLVFYEAENLSDQPLIGMATFNVTPNQAGTYFHKIHCFCFAEQRLEAGQKAILPVSFYIDPAIENERSLAGVDTITLSYTFFPFQK